jgi:glutamate decarboxylase
MSQQDVKIVVQEMGPIPHLYGESGIQETIAKLFGNSEETWRLESADESRVTGIVERFLSDVQVSTDIEIGPLAEMFKRSWILDEPCETADYLDYIAHRVVPHAIRTSSPRFIGHMTSALPYFVRPVAKLVAALNQNQVKLETSKVLSFYERQAIAMIHNLIFEYPESFYARHVQNRDSTLGVITSGGTIANITALLSARNSCLGRRDGFAGVEECGLPAALNHYGYSGAVVIGSTQLHYSFEKAAGALGIGVESLIRVPVDRAHRIQLPALRKAIAECQARRQRIIAVVGIAGTTESGAIDPLREIAELVREVGAHFHVDAAWGGALLFSDLHRRQLAGIEEADSVTIDGHKQLYLPMGTGLLLFRDPSFARVIEKQAKYVVREGSHDLGRRSLEGSRPATVMFLHAALSILGRKGYQHLIDEGIRKTRHMARSIHSRPEFEVLVEPMMNILTYRFLPESLRAAASASRLTESENQVINLTNERLQRLQRKTGHSFVSRTTLTTTRLNDSWPVVALRAVLANPLTTESDIEAVLDHQLRLAASL